MKKTCFILASLLSGLVATAAPEVAPEFYDQSTSLSSRPFKNHSALLNPLDVTRRGRTGTTVRFGLQVMPILELIGEGKNTAPDKTGMLVHKKSAFTGGAGLVLKAELSPYFQFETGVNYVRKTYAFEQKGFTTEGVSGTYDLSVPANQFEFPVLLSFGFGSGRTQSTFFRPVLGLILSRYQYGDKKESRNISSSDPNLTFEVSKATLRDLDNTTSYSSALGVIGFRILSAGKKSAFEYGLSYCHDLGEGDKMYVQTSLINPDPRKNEAHTLTLIPQTNFIRLHLAYYFYNSR